MGDTVNLREEAVNVLCGDDPDEFGPCPVHAQDLDALLDWLSVNAERIEHQTKYDSWDQERGRWIGHDAEAHEIRSLVAVLRGNND